MQRTKIKPIEIYYLTITTWKSNFNLIQFISYNIMIQNITFYWYYRIHSLNSVSMDIYMIMQMRSLRSGHTVLGERHSPSPANSLLRPAPPTCGLEPRGFAEMGESHAPQALPRATSHITICTGAAQSSKIHAGGFWTDLFVQFLKSLLDGENSSTDKVPWTWTGLSRVGLPPFLGL